MSSHHSETRCVVIYSGRSWAKRQSPAARTRPSIHFSLWNTTASLHLCPNYQKQPVPSGLNVQLIGTMWTRLHSLSVGYRTIWEPLATSLPRQLPHTCTDQCQRHLPTPTLCWGHLAEGVSLVGSLTCWGASLGLPSLDTQRTGQPTLLKALRLPPRPHLWLQWNAFVVQSLSNRDVNMPPCMSSLHSDSTSSETGTRLGSTSSSAPDRRCCLNIRIQSPS